MFWLARERIRRLPGGVALLAHPAVPWLARLALAAIFIFGLVDLARDAIALV